ncbi:MAG: hypothetical protein U5K31_00325 [Balneolaceae bacterium]|nr:hypothetical protein [Balneolaceae bacterium]
MSTVSESFFKRNWRTGIHPASKTEVLTGNMEADLLITLGVPCAVAGLPLQITLWIIIVALAPLIWSF